MITNERNKLDKQWRDLKTMIEQVLKASKLFFDLRHQLITYVVSDPACARVKADLTKVQEDYAAVTALMPELNNYQTNIIDNLLKQGKVEELYKKNAELKRFSERFNSLKYL